MNDAHMRLRSWIRDFGHLNQPPFIADLEAVLAENQTLREPAPPQPAEAVLLAEFEAAEVLWEEGKPNDTYHETETVADAQERLLRDRDAMPILEFNGDGFIVSKYRDGYYVRTGINCPDQIRRAKPQS